MWKSLITNYEINDIGQLRNSRTGRILKPKTTSKGYVQYGISINGKYKDVSAHRAVAEMFIPNPDGKPEVNHKDGNKKNNHYSNLEWSTGSENVKHSFDNGLNSMQRKHIPVNQLSKSGELIKTYSSITEAAQSVNGYTSHISSCCNGSRRTHKGYKWSYAF